MTKFFSCDKTFCHDKFFSRDKTFCFNDILVKLLPVKTFCHDKIFSRDKTLSRQTFFLRQFLSILAVQTGYKDGG